jgi:signal transduction histidine kinase
MKRVVLKIKNRWSKLALHTRITISMIAVLILGLSVSAIVTYRLFLNMLTNRVGRKVLVDFVGDTGGNGSRPGLDPTLDGPNTTSRQTPEIHPFPDNPDPILPRDRGGILFRSGPNHDEFFARIGQEVNSSLMLFFIATTLGITIIGALCVYFLTRKALRQVQGEQERLKEFMANASHDLRTPLTVISGYAQLLNSKTASAQETEEYAEHIIQNATRMQSLVEDMLLTTELDEDDLARKVGNPPSKQNSENEYDLSKLLQSIVNDFTQIYTERNISLDNDSILVHFPPGDIHRIVQNLLTNACRYAGNDAAVTLSARESAGVVTLSVSDTGVGVAKDKLDYIFERFTKVDSSRNTQGNGLGLSIVKDLTLKLGGDVEARPSDKVTGRGLTVEVKLPLQP